MFQRREKSLALAGSPKADCPVHSSAATLTELSQLFLCAYILFTT